jgi:hypothetical protein
MSRGRDRGLRRLPGGASRETWSFEARFVENGSEGSSSRAAARPGATVIDSDRRQGVRAPSGAVRRRGAGSVRAPARRRHRNSGGPLLPDGTSTARRWRDASARRRMAPRAPGQRPDSWARSRRAFIASIGAGTVRGLPQPPGGRSGLRGRPLRIDPLRHRPEPHPALVRLSLVRRTCRRRPTRLSCTATSASAT